MIPLVWCTGDRAGYGIHRVGFKRKRRAPSRGGDSVSPSHMPMAPVTVRKGNLHTRMHSVPGSGEERCPQPRVGTAATLPWLLLTPQPSCICAQAEGWDIGQWQTQASPHRCNPTAAAGGGWPGPGAGRVGTRWLRTGPGKQSEAGQCVSPGSKSPELGPVGLT